MTLPAHARSATERIARYAYRYWMRHGMTEWPTVKQASRSLRIRQVDIEDRSGDGRFDLTSYHTAPPQELSEHFVKATIPEVELAWENSWHPLSQCDFVKRIAPEPHHDKPSLLRAFDEIVTGPVDSVHIERMSDNLYWMAITKGGQSQRIVIGSANGRSKVIARTEID